MGGGGETEDGTIYTIIIDYICSGFLEIPLSWMFIVWTLPGIASPLSQDTDALAKENLQWKPTIKPPIVNYNIILYNII